MLINNCFIDVQHVSHELLESVLEIADSRMTYRSRYLANLQIPAVLDLLLTDDTNPRALAYQLERTAESRDEFAALVQHARLHADQRLAHVDVARDSHDRYRIAVRRPTRLAINNHCRTC